MLLNKNTCEPPHDKTNKMTVRPVNTRISLGIRPGWFESLLGAHAVFVMRLLISVMTKYWDRHTGGNRSRPRSEVESGSRCTLQIVQYAQRHSLIRLWAIYNLSCVFWTQSLMIKSHYLKTPKNSDTKKLAVIILKFEPCGFTIE